MPVPMGPHSMSGTRSPAPFPPPTCFDAIVNPTPSVIFSFPLLLAANDDHCFLCIYSSERCWVISLYLLAFGQISLFFMKILFCPRRSSPLVLFCHSFFDCIYCSNLRRILEHSNRKTVTFHTFSIVHTDIPLSKRLPRLLRAKSPINLLTFPSLHYVACSPEFR